MPDNELAAALRWRIKDLVSFPAAEAAVDYFETPVTSPEHNKNMLNVVVAHLQMLETTAKWIQASGLALTAIDIPELALRNMTASLQEDSDGIALLLLQPKACRLLITRQGSLYLIRDINLAPTPFLLDEQSSTATSETYQSLLETLVLEIQRSFGFYQNRLRQALPKHLFVLGGNPSVLSDLATQLNCATKALDLKTIVQTRQPLSVKLQMACLFAIGGALRNEHGG